MTRAPTRGERSMSLDKFTVKAQEALQAAQSLADREGHQALEPEHLLAALVEQPEGVVGPLLAKLGARREAIQQALRAELAKLPTVTGGHGHHLRGLTRHARHPAPRRAARPNYGDHPTPPPPPPAAPPTPP